MQTLKNLLEYDQSLFQEDSYDLLIGLDEVGRGTSTYDGIAIAWSCLEYILKTKKTRTLFSTHYHELVDLSKEFENLKCYTVSTKEWQDKVIFMHKLIPGTASKSYGLNVARIAGLPHNVINRAQEILEDLHNQNEKVLHPTKITNSHEPNQSSLLKIKDKLTTLDIDNITPKEALTILYKLKEKIT